ncbi:MULTISPECIES: ATP-binding cassette domain-containing protein [Anoxybacillus]|uniref:ATP-binding cassette domain-containing protein n=1 Tax=Anoxybacillus TaxID=150247 RepID=UPI001865EB9D|nr:ABC transporter ATP-binding protein [Anoxybacillus flavithermus]MBE2907277.1 ABC transporter ATP-binding protein [Anoxybacillus flavithermus]MBE2909815.1 ABC transporter ATP-binding protein [Anoxybacillus flavithermus]MBE2915108.1 ABC transporter ATP-binding protein [Anoxybacillus flavithermus]MBE2917639.1 ABC transporter ATP-binding protein [Anoxybacillus flavithermus]MBE2920555.1 ABC transporter ATP-binding protein [Anoxybacillus flavithermus]
MNIGYGLIVENFTKEIKNVKIFENARLSIESGKVVHLDGENGVGKTTFLRCVAGYESFEEGNILVLGHDLKKMKRELLRKLIYFVPSNDFSFCDLLTPREYFLFVRNFFKKDHCFVKERELIERLFLEVHLDKQISRLSFGTKKKVVFLASLVADPYLLVCDEIFEGLDFNSVEAVKEIILERKKTGAITLFTTHIRGEASKVADHFCVIKKRKILNLDRK